jgi:hypothetical protein
MAVRRMSLKRQLQLPPNTQDGLPAAAPLPPPPAALGLAAPPLAVLVVRRMGALALAAPAAAAAAMAVGRAALVFLGARGGLAREAAAAVPGREPPAVEGRAAPLPPAQGASCS